MTRVLRWIAGTVVAGAAAVTPAIIGVVGNPSFSQQLPVRVPSQARLADETGRLASPSAPAPSPGPVRPTDHRPLPSAEDSSAPRGEPEPGDDHGGSSHSSEPGDDHPRDRTSSSSGDRTGDGHGGGHGGGSGGSDDGDDGGSGGSGDSGGDGHGGGSDSGGGRGR